MRALLAGLCLLASGTASAGTIVFTGTLTIDLHVGFIPMVFGGQGVATTSGGGFALPADIFTGTQIHGFVGSSTPPAPISQATYAVTGHGPGSFGGSPLGGSLPLRGGILLRGYGGLTLVELRLSGAGGAIGSGDFTFSQPILGLMTVQAAAWTTGQISSVVRPSQVLVTSGFDGRGPNGVGAVRLVTSFLFEGRVGPFGGFAILDLNFVPEPPGPAAVALACGALAALWLGGERVRRG